VGRLDVFTLIGGAVLLMMIGLYFIQWWRIKLLSERLDHLTMGADGQSLEDVLGSHLQTVVHVVHDLEEVAARTAVLEGASRLHFSRLGLVRFNPFDDTGGNQSFALAMLDANNDGFVISSLHSRTGTRVYAKAIFEGVCESPLSTEEEKAVGIAVSQGGAAVPVGAPLPEPEPAPSPVKKPARQRPAAAGGRATTSSLAKPVPAAKAARKSAVSAKAKGAAPVPEEAEAVAPVAEEAEAVAPVAEEPGA
jgi:hypothetical protein